MPTYSFVCAKGHVTDEVFRFADRPRAIRCGKCSKRAQYDLGATHRDSRIGIDNDCPEHYNPTIGCVVKSRRHLRDIQRRYAGERGIEMQNYEPVKKREREKPPPNSLGSWGERRQ